jgi:hypothetical protein
MAVCRFNDDSDVYVYYSVLGGIDCCGCILLGRGAFVARDEAAMITHLNEHVAAGHKVPAKAFERLAQREE